jgi:CBS domain-containing protein
MGEGGGKTVEDVMTREVVTVTPDTGFQELIATMAEHQVSGVPVLEGARLVGVVSEADLLREGEGDRKRTSALEWFRHPRRAQEAHDRGHMARDIMTTEVVSVTRGTSIWRAIRTLREANVKRLPVVDPDGGVVGIVSRVDLLSAFIRTDQQIAEEISQILRQVVATDLRRIDVRVDEGRVAITGSVDHGAERDIVTRLIRHIPGVLELRTDLEISAERGQRIPFAPIVPPGKPGPEVDV